MVESAFPALPMHGNQRTPAGFALLPENLCIVNRGANNQGCGIIRENRD
jgi:hypothetical protein